MTITTGIVGAAGFAGIELVRLILRHPDFKLVALTSNEMAGVPVAVEYPCFTGATDLVFSAHDNPALDMCDLIFLAVPHTVAMSFAPRFVERGAVVIDLSADFRLRDPAVYEQWYKTSHTRQDLLSRAVFGLPELFPDELLEARRTRIAGRGVLVACAGCYPTATSLAAVPAIRSGLVNKTMPIVVDAISGVTGAGKKPTARTHFNFANENLEAYGVAAHRHTPEIEQILGLKDKVIFTPHLAPLNRGLLSTVTMFLASEVLPETSFILEQYQGFYRDFPCVFVLGENKMPRTSSVVGTNYAHVGLAVDARTRALIAVCAIDNLTKGAAGQAVQCANIIWDLPEMRGLDSIAPVL